VELLQGGADPEAEFSSTYQELVLRDLAREHLDDRERRIFFEIHYRGRSGAQVGRELGLSGQRVGQIYVDVARRLRQLARHDPLFSATWEHDTDEEEDT
jgi:DNA-directed RNA polymerase sigma subunit (sigma70/sigma32)